MNKLLALTSLGLAVLITLTGCAAAPKEQSLNIGSMPTQTASIYAVGIEKGIFKKHNLNVNLTIFSSAIERDAAATAGTLDGFLTDIMGVVNLNENNYPYKITSSEYENFCVLAGKMQTAKTTEQLAGFKVGVANNTVTEYMADTLLKGINVEKVNLPKVPERFAALMSGDIQTGVFPEPFVSMIKAKGGYAIVSGAENNLQPVVFVFSEKALKEKTQINNFYSAYNEITTYMKDTPYADYKDVLLKYKLISPELVDQIKLPLEQYGDAKMVSKQDVENVLSWMNEKKMIKNTYTFESLIDQGALK
jgi:NitT/TauT family transport system substrate-binding protein